MNQCVEHLRQDILNGSTLHTQLEFKSLTSHTNVILSVLEAVFGSTFMRPTYAKAITPKTPAVETAEAAVNISVAVVLAMALESFVW